MLNNNSNFQFFIYLMLFNLSYNGHSVDLICFSNLLEIEDKHHRKKSHNKEDKS